jgi:hypothetical protein
MISSEQKIDESFKAFEKRHIQSLFWSTLIDKERLSQIIRPISSWVVHWPWKPLKENQLAFRYILQAITYQSSLLSILTFVDMSLAELAFEVEVDQENNRR